MPIPESAQIEAVQTGLVGCTDPSDLMSGEWASPALPFFGYPLVNVYITMENHHFQWVHPLFLWAIFNSYVKLPEGTMELFLMQDFKRIGEISAEPMAMKQH